MPHVDVTLVVPTLGASTHLPAFVRSLQAQTLEHFEAVFVTSTTDTQSMAVLEPLTAQDARLRLVPGPAGRGGDVAWAHGLEAAQGAFVAFASPQDMLPPTSLEVRLAACKQHAAVVRGCVEYVRPDGTREQAEQPQASQGRAHGNGPGLALNDFLQAPWGWMLPTGLVRRNNPFTYARGVDPLALVTRCMWLPDVVYSRVRHTMPRQIRSRVQQQAQALLQATLAAEQSLRGAFAGALADLPALQADTQAANGDAGLVDALGAAVLGGVRRFKGGDNILAELGRQLTTLKAQAAQGGGERLEVVIFPYKSCVFDSVESIWRAAAADPDCEAHLVPIPYFERLPDGTFARMCYEGSDFPPDVPVEDWRDYDVKARHPDVIIIHNPWDDTNGLTSVHPTFYARRLEHLTRLLVYVPYFVTVDGNLGAFYACHPGALHAHRIAVQSEDVRQQYISYFKDFEEKYQCKGTFGVPEEKFVALGSPKYDKLAIAKTAEHALPEAWQKLLIRSDGSRRQAVFYNTSVWGIGLYGASYIHRIRDTIAFFAAQDDVVLWWRPHPLAIPEMRRCHPNLAGEYEALVEEYKNGGKGIYDDTPEPYLALTETQGYFGDMSSLIEMYRVGTRRPILVQAIPPLQHVPLQRTITCALVDNAGIWCVPRWSNALYYLARDDTTMVVKARFPGVKDAGKVFTDVVKVGNTLYFAPCSAVGVGVFDCTSEEVSLLNIGEPPDAGGLRYDASTKFSTLFDYNDHLFLVGHTWPGILRINPRTGERHCYTDMLAHVAANAARTHWNSAKRVDAATLCLVPEQGNHLIFFHMDTGQWEVCRAGNADDAYLDVCNDGDDYWLVHAHTPRVTHWNRRSGTSASIDLSAFVQITQEQVAYLKGKDMRCLPFKCTVFHQGRVWVFPWHSRCPVTIDRQGTVEPATGLRDALWPLLDQEPKTSLVYAVAQATPCGDALLLNINDNIACMYAPATGETHIYSVAGRSWIEGGEATLADTMDMVYDENHFRSLPWLKAVLQQQAQQHAATASHAGENTAGARIYQYCKQTLAGHQGAS